MIRHPIAKHPMVAPVAALICGVLILIFPEILNFVVAVYLIMIGILGIFGRV